MLTCGLRWALSDWCIRPGVYAASQTHACSSSRATRGTRLLAEARSVLSQVEDIPLLDTVIAHRQIVADAFTQAVSVLDATTGPGLESGNEFNRLFSEVFPNG